MRDISNDLPYLNLYNHIPMFNGIIGELGEVYRIRHTGQITLLEVSSNDTFKNVNIGDSIAVNGVCLTVIKKYNNILTFEVMFKTLKSTNLGALRIRDKVNLESSLKLGDRLSGHFVYGHIDCMGIIRRRSFVQSSLRLDIAVPIDVARRIIVQDSIAVDGISLTVQNKRGNIISVYIIPHTLKNTTLGFKGSSDKVNIETDKLKTLLLADR